jgi:RNA polymerase sigma-70 factor (ECF subfamily)
MAIEAWEEVMTTVQAHGADRALRAGSTEAQLKARMLAGLGGDPKAHAALLRAVAPLLRSYFARRMRDDPGDVEDLVQETLIAVHTRRGSFDRDRKFTPWLFSIARHKLVDHFRRTFRHQPTEGLEEILVTEGFEQSSNAAMDVDRLLETLPIKQARAIRDTRIQGLSIAEAAERAGLGLSDVKVSVHRGLKALSGCVATANCR